jgi:DNA-binding XRE family transcriptional regulator
LQFSAAVHGPWIIAHAVPIIPAVPNLTSRRQDPALVALGQALRRIREAQSVSQERLALLAEVDRSYVGRVERGDNNVAVLTLVRLAGALGITVAALMEQAGL